MNLDFIGKASKGIISLLFRLIEVTVSIPSSLSLFAPPAIISRFSSTKKQVDKKLGSGNDTSNLLYSFSSILYLTIEEYSSPYI